MFRDNGNHYSKVTANPLKPSNLESVMADPISRDNSMGRADLDTDFRMIIRGGVLSHCCQHTRLVRPFDPMKQKGRHNKKQVKS